MVLHVGSFLQMKEFDWIEDYMPHRQFLQARPNLYAAWCHTVLDAVELIEDYMREELDLCTRQLGWTRHDLLNALPDTDTAPSNPKDQISHPQTCSQRQYKYGPIAYSLVEPARIADQECVKIGHGSDCRCRDIPEESGLAAGLAEYTGMWCYADVEDDSDIDEDFVDAQPHIFDPQCLPSPSNCNVFSDVAGLLYSAQGRIRSGSYSIGEYLCAACFLLREQYIGGDGFAAEFPPMPKSFESFHTRG
jgi:hypothetical protein